MSAYDINWSAKVVGTTGNVGPGDVLCPDVTNDNYVQATTANLAAVGRIGGVAISAVSPPGQAVLQYSGEIAAVITGLGAGIATAVGINSSGRMVRLVATPAATDFILGDCDVLGAVTLSPVSRTLPAAAGVVASGVTNVVLSGSVGSITLSPAQYGNRYINFSGSDGAVGTFQAYMPALVRDWVVYNGATTGDGPIRFSVLGGSGVSVASGRAAIVWSDGTNVYREGPDLVRTT